MKNEFVVTWLTITKWWLPLLPKVPDPPDDVAAAAELVLLLEPQASSAAAAIPAAAPVSAVRRVN